jgi:protein-S-isoprenylcysteine O-methyltransferase Ste14
MPRDLWGWIEWVWLAVGVYWLAAALRSKPVARREGLWLRVCHTGLLAAALALLFSDATRVGVLGTRLLPASDWTGGVGLGLTAAGCAFAVWARAWLGSDWSGMVTLKRDHRLVRTGPYAVVRHPIYAGLLLGLLGTALAVGEVRGLPALVLAFAAWHRKARTEEQFLEEQFPQDYPDYRCDVKQLIPFVF